MKNLFPKNGCIVFVFLFCGMIRLNAQGITIRGVVSSADQEPLTGVTVVEEKTKNGVITDSDGEFVLEISSSKASLVFNYVGYRPKTIEVNGQAGYLKVVLDEDTRLLDEVVVIGYGTVKKSDLTGAVTSIKADELKNTATAGIESALQGKIPGVFINKKSGKPGETADVKIRGVGSFRGTGPLWIIDGVQQDPKAEFNMNDAESVEILRDGSAAAIYGASAANGVILVTTKRGKNAAKMTFNSYIGTTSPTNLPDMLNSRQLKTLRLEDFNGQGSMTEAEMLAFPATFSRGDIRAYALDFDLTNADYPWRDLIFSQGVTQNYDLSFSKGNDDYNYYASFNYFDEKGMYIDTDFKRYSFRLNTDIRINKWLSFGESMQISYTERNPESNTNYLNNYIRTLPFMMPYDESNQPGGFGYFPTKDADGNELKYPTLAHPERFPEEYTTIKNMLNLYDGSNLLADELTSNRRNKSYNMTGNVYAKFTPLKDLTITTTLTGGFGAGNDHGEIGQFEYYRKDNATKSRLYSQVVQNLNQTHSIGWQTVANYYTKINALHELTVMLGSEGKKYYGTTLNASATNMLGDLYYISLAEQKYQTVGDSYSNGASMSFFGRVNYSYNDKYLLMALIRRDGYDRFGPKNRWGNFPSFSGAWKIGDENFIRDNESLNWLSGLKLRASWGLLGNSGIPQFLYVSKYINDNSNYAWGATNGIYGEQTYAQGVRLNQLANEKIKWEEIRTTDIGLDLGLFNNRLLFSFDWFIKNTSDALFDTSLPGMAGLGKNAGNNISYTLNVGQIRNTGCDFELTFRDKINNDFNYSVNANLGFVRNTVLATDDSNAQLIAGAVTGGHVAYTQIGKPMSTFWGYKVEGVFQTQEEVDAANRLAAEKGGLDNQGKPNYPNYQEALTGPGDLKFRDINGDGHIDTKDVTDLGNPWPDFTYGITIGCNYKWVDFSVLFQGTQGNEIYNEYRTKTHTLFGDYSTTTYALNRWTGPGSTNKNFRLSDIDPNHNEGRVSSWFVEDGSYLRLKNISLGVTLPKRWVNKVLVSNCRLYVSAQNLLTFTRYEGFDPEFSAESAVNTEYGIDRGYYPQGKTLLCGVQLDF